MHYQNENDETLVMLTLAGEQTAYEVLVVRYQKAVIASALSVTRNQFMAEDAAQDAFVTAWMKLNTLQEGTKYRPWVCRIAKNCALNMIMRYRRYLPLDVVGNLDMGDDPKLNPAELYALSEENDELHRSIAKLPEKVKQIIHLHYFDGLSIAEISDKMRISEGTVKWQLHDGRKRIRKELCAMNEKHSDTLVRRVMKKVEELKLWQIKNDKSGFEVVYKDVLRDVEELPESEVKSHALADVLLRGWWWLPGDKNDALFTRIANAALEGKNEEAMTFIVIREDSQVGWGWSEAKIDFIRDKQIPRLEKAGFQCTLGREWFWLGYYYFRDGKPELGHEAYDRVIEILSPSDAYYTMVPYACDMEKTLATDYKEKSPKRYLIGYAAQEYHIMDGALRFWNEEAAGEGYMVSFDSDIDRIYRNSCLCDGLFYADIKPGETHTGSDGTTLTFVCDSETVKTPAGNFGNCQLWVTKHINWSGKSVYKSYYKDGIGIVKHEHIKDGLTDVRLLSDYHIEGGTGFLPMAKGNTWEYTAGCAPDIMKAELKFTVFYADEKTIILTSWENVERLKYDDNSWLDMIQQISNDYWKEEGGSQKLCDVSYAAERAEALAKTPMEKTHTKAAVSVSRRIMATDPTFNPDHTATGHWNFFEKLSLQKKNGALSLSGHNGRWAFEWKRTGSMGAAEDPILYNDIYGILQDAANCIWSEEWQIGASAVVEYPKYDKTVKTQILCEDCGILTTKAGVFENCMKLSLDVGGMTEGLSYRGGKKVYYFANSVGIIRTENEYCAGARTAIYELTSYKGIGDGYMPLADGMMRRYDALDLTDGFVGSAEYTYVADSEGDIVIFSDRTGIRELPPPITQYSAIQGEALEDCLWNEGKWEETHLRHAVNNLNLMLHYLARAGWHRNNADRTAGICSFNLNLMEMFGGENGVPSAWGGLYAWHSLVRAAALFGKGEKGKGYKCLERALEHMTKWSAYKPGDLLEIGNDEVFGGVRYVKGQNMFKLPDGTREPVSYNYRIDPNPGMMYNCISAQSGWEWFNSVRHEEHFKEYVKRAKALMEHK